MKKQNDILFIAIVTMLLTITATSGCKKDDNNNNNSINCKALGFSVVRDGTTAWGGGVYQYNSQNMVVLDSLTVAGYCEYVKRAISYSGSLVQINEAVYNYQITLNSAGMPTHTLLTHPNYSDTYDATYGTDGKLTSVTDHYSYFGGQPTNPTTTNWSNFTYDANGNLTGYTTTTTDDVTHTSYTPSNFTFTYYTDKLYKNEFDPLMKLYALSGKHSTYGGEAFESTPQPFSKNLLKKIQTDGGATTIDFAYTFDADGNVVSVTITNNSGAGNYTLVKTITYQCS